MELRDTSEALAKFDREYPALLDEIIQRLDRMAALEEELRVAYVVETGKPMPNHFKTTIKIREDVEVWRKREGWRTYEEEKAQANPKNTSGDA